MDAHEEIWILGTKPTQLLLGKLEFLKKEHDKDLEQNKFFMQDNFDIKHCCRPITNLDQRSDNNMVPYYFLRQIVNDLIHQLNTRAKIARYILVLIGDKVLEDVNFVKIGFRTIFTKLVDEILFALVERITSLPTKAALSFVPEVCFVKMLPKLEKHVTSEFKTSRRKFNKVLENELPRFGQVKFTFASVKEITSENEDYFHNSGDLNDSGQLVFWFSINNLLKEKEEQRLMELPRLDKNTQTDKYIGLAPPNNQTDRSHRNRHFNDRGPRERRDTTYRSDYFSHGRNQQRRSYPFEQNDRFHYYRGNGQERRDK